MLLAVNFHYIGDESAYKKGIYPISSERLSRQIEALGRHFQFVSGKDLQEAIEKGKKLPERACLITFDDGLECQYQSALPVLDKKGVPAMFFACSAPYEDGKVLAVHKIHYLLSILSDNDFAKKISKGLEKFGQPIDFGDETLREKALLKYRYDKSEAAVVKYILNVLLDEEARNAVVSEVFAGYVKNERKFAVDWYFSRTALKELAGRGYLGLHSHNHIKMNGTPKEVAGNISKNKKILEKISGGKIFAFSYPYGNKQDINIKAAGAIKKLGVVFAFTMERAFNKTLKEPLLLARADTNDVLGGKNPCFEFKKGQLEIVGKFSDRRSMFFME